jgi:uncharacterized protein YdiU (UPF0061 family)
LRLQGDESLIDELFVVMHDTGTDFTNCFLILEELDNENISKIIDKMMEIIAPEENYLKRFKPMYSK